MKRIIAVLLVALSLGFAPAQTTLQLILDASGSMFNRLDDGRYRIVAAKDVLTNMIGALPAADDLNVGLRVYGASSDALAEGACTDSELVVPMEGFDRSALLDAVADTQARGATPIAYSLEQAIGDFSGFEGKKLLVLVTDGEESCGGDVRAVAERLTASGVEVDLRIIGFDLSDAAAASFEGIGTFENARSAEELAAALGRAVEAAGQAPQDEALEVTVEVTRQGEPAEGADVTFVSSVGGEAFDFDVRETGTLVADLPAGSYRAEVEDALSDAPLTVSNVVVSPEDENVFSFELAPESTVELSVSPAEPVAGSSVTVEYRGAPANDDNWITVVPADAPDGAYASWSYVGGEDGSVEIQVPVEPGQLEARFLAPLPEGGDRVIGRSDPFTSVEASASVDAPAQVTAGSQFDVEWTGPNNARDYITVVSADAPQGAYTSYEYTRDGSPASITAPVEAGTYEVRYVAGQGDEPTLATDTITVTEAKASVTAPEEVLAGAQFEVAWKGPSNERDYITIVPEGADQGAYLSYTYTREGSPVSLIAPQEPGTYEVRYVAGQGDDPTLASQTITVSAADYAVQAPAEVEPRTTFEVTWEGPSNPKDYITVVPEGAAEGNYMDYAYTSEGNPVELIAPSEPGTYEVRYTTDQSPNPTLASQTITVVSVEYGLDAPETVAAGESFQVEWTGPGGQRDYVTIVPAGAAEGEYMDYAYTREGNPVTIQAPEEPGEYEVRYQTDSDGVFASTTITVE